MKKIYLLLLLLSVTFTACGRQSGNEETELKEKIAQMLMVGFRGTELSPDNHIYNDIKDLKIGGVILFEYDAPSKSRPRNVLSEKQVTSLVLAMQAVAETKLFVAIDQEGGMVNRLKENYGFPATVSPRYLGETDNPDTTALWAQRTARLLSQMGVNLNFAPSVDLNVNPSNPVIGKLGRSFSADPETVTNHARIWIDEHKKYGVISSLKHFPGHGSSRSDSHLGFTDVTATWSETELVPYRTLIGEGECDMVMTSHVFNANLDPQYPATMSKAVLTAILREELGYAGVIVTDDMAMGAIVEHYALEEALEKTINAGADILILSNNGSDYDPQIAKKAVEIIYECVVDGRIDRETIENSYTRIIALKRKYGILQ